MKDDNGIMSDIGRILEGDILPEKINNQLLFISIRENYRLTLKVKDLAVENSGKIETNATAIAELKVGKRELISWTWIRDKMIWPMIMMFFAYILITLIPDAIAHLAAAGP